METISEPMEGSLPPTDLVEMTKHATQQSSIKKFYSGTNILITGGTGFMGKLLIEKLLRSCPDIQTIYLLIRPKHGKDMFSRLDEIFDDPVFNRLKQQDSKFRHKIIGINGDCAIGGLGLSNNDRCRLIDNVNIVFHVAATIRFDEPLRFALAINVHATQDIIELSKQIMNLKAFTYVGTAYSHCVLNEIHEKLYNVPIRADELDKMISKMDDEELKLITPNIIKEWPNTYTFTKAIAEDEIAENCNGLRVGIFRPGIVLSTYKEPLEGWVSNMYGPNGVTAGVCKGLLRTIRGNPENNGNIVPADMCVNSLICAGWDIGTRPICRNKEDIPIYNYVSSDNAITWGEIITLNFLYTSKYPFSDTYWCANLSINKDKHIALLLRFLLHYIPAFFIDLLLIIQFKKPQMINVYKKVHKLAEVLEPFSMKELKFTNVNVQNLWKRIDYNDKKEFFFNIADMDWLSYFRNYIKGMRVYYFNDPLTTLPQARRRHQRFQIIQFFIIAFFYFVLIYVLLFILTSVGHKIYRLMPFIN